MNNLLAEAQELVYGERAKQYGDPKPHFEKVAVRWSQIFGIDISPEQVVLAMVDLKMARLCHSIGHVDSWRDIAGYVAVSDLLNETEEFPAEVAPVELVLEQVKAEVAKPETKPTKAKTDKVLSFADELKGFLARSGMSFSELADATGIPRATLHAYCQGRTVPSSERRTIVRDFTTGYSPGALSKPEPIEQPVPEPPTPSKSGVEFSFGQEAAFTLLKNYATGKVIDSTWQNLALLKQKENLVKGIREGREDQVWDLLEGGVKVAR